MPPRIKNFTPVLDTLVDQFGLVTAAVWGRVWRYEQGPDKVCRAAHKTLAAGLGISTRTVIRHLETLIEAGYIIDRTPDQRNKPHELVTTQKARVIVTIEATDEGVTESQSGVTESHSRYDRESHEESIKKQVKKEKDVKDSPRKKRAPRKPAEPVDEPKEPTEQQAMFEALMDVTMLDPAIKANAARMGRVAGGLVKGDYTPEQVRALFQPGAMWYTQDWRGQRGDPPTPEQVGERIKAFMSPELQDFKPAQRNGRMTTYERNMAGLMSWAEEDA